MRTVDARSAGDQLRPVGCAPREGQAMRSIAGSPPHLWLARACRTGCRPRYLRVIHEPRLRGQEYGQTAAKARNLLQLLMNQKIAFPLAQELQPRLAEEPRPLHPPDTRSTVMLLPAASCGGFVQSGSHGGVWVKRIWIQRRICKTPAVVSHPRSEPASVIWSFPHQIKLTFGRRVMRPHHNPACGGQGSRGRDHS